MKYNAFFIGLSLVFSVVSQPISAVSGSCEYTGPQRPVKGEFIKEIRVLTMNVWGQNDDSEAKCEARLKTIGKRIANARPSFDIAGLTEVHPDYAGVTCNGKKLVDAIQAGGEYTGNKARWGHPETSWKDYDGGTSLFSMTKFDWDSYQRHVHRYTPKLNPRTAMGFIFAQIRVTPEITIDVYVTHIHSTDGGPVGSDCDQRCKYNELRQLARGIHERSSNSGNPVLVMGDFNIGGPNPTPTQCNGNSGYGDIMELLRNPRDVWLEAHPNKSGATHSSERIDFMFLLTDPYFTNSPYELVISDPENVKLVKWQMPGFTKRGQWHKGPFRVSDHFGFEATFGVHKRFGWETIMIVID